MDDLRFRLGNAPCSWGTIESTEGERVPYGRMLDELRQAGYTGTELGDWGYMPTDEDSLDAELERRDLSMIGSWVTVRLFDESRREEDLSSALAVARLLAATGGPGSTVNLGDDHAALPERSRHAGRIGPEHGLSEAGWKSYTESAQRIARAVREETGLRTCLHPHGATYVETPAEIREFLGRTDPELIGIVLDTGHYALGGGDPVAAIREHAPRITLVHFKDFDPQVLERAREEGWDYREMVGRGVFPELGRGAVDFTGALAALEEIGYDGWIVVEQDVLPGMGSPLASARRNREYLRTLGL